MPADSIVRVSFQSNVPANQAANTALVGAPEAQTGTGPFEKVGTAAYSAAQASEIDVATSLAALGNALLHHANSIDFLSISVVRRS